MRKWENKDKEYLIELIKGGKSIKEVSLIIDRTIRSVERKISIWGYKISDYKQSYYILKTCKKCECEFNSLISDGRIFCSKSCSNSFANLNRTIDYKKTKEIDCVSCGEKILVKVNTDNVIKCDSCSLKKCKYCNNKVSGRKHHVCDECISYSGYILFYEKLKIYDKNDKLININKKAVKILSDLYYDKKYSRLQISQILGIDKKTLFNFFKRNEFKLRNLSESLCNAVLQGRWSLPEIKNQYKTGHHKSWEDKVFYYRSSYELKYCEYLDSVRIKYEMETKRIVYYDSIRSEEHTSEL